MLRATTFVVGAGGSCPYGLPSGGELRERANRLRPESEWYQLIDRGIPDVQGTALNTWLEEARRHPTSSIDDFLLMRQDDHAAVATGRLVIAALMAQAMIERDKENPRERWLHLVFERMHAQASTFEQFLTGNAGVRFVTFNFDSLIEEHLLRHVAALYRQVDVARLLQTVPVIHVHGRLPQPPSGRVFGRLGQGDVREEWYRWLLEAAPAVKIIYDGIDGGTLTEAHNAVATAEVLFFLGMAYHPNNLERLGILPGARPLASQVVFGTAKGLPLVDCNRVMTTMPISLSGPQFDCAQSLQMLPWLSVQPSGTLGSSMIE